MLSAEDFAAIKIAVEICNCPLLKREILRVFNKWNENIRNKAHPLLENLGLVTCLHKKVIGLLLVVGMRMLTWATYHEDILQCPRDVSINMLNGGLFTSRGIIDYKKTAEKLMKYDSLNIKQKYKLACLYCFDDQILNLFRHMSPEDQVEFYDVHNPENIEQLPLFKFWSYFEMGEVDKCRGERNLDEYLLMISIESGSISAVESCLVRTESNKIEKVLMTAALETAREIFYIKFRDRRTPIDFFIDLLYFLYQKMSEDQQIEFLKKNLNMVDFGPRNISVVSRVFAWFLHWPYQDFCETAVNLIWEFLSEDDFAKMLEEICCLIETSEYFEDKIYNYRKLLKELWCWSPQTFKSYIFSEKYQYYSFFFSSGTFLKKYLLLKNFTIEDNMSIGLIFGSATENEKINWISCEDGKFLCQTLLLDEKWRILNVLLSNCFTTHDQVQIFKRNLSFSLGAQRLLINFVKNKNWDGVEFFVRWSAFSKDDLIYLQKEMILSGNIKRECSNLIIYDCNVKTAKSLCEWAFISNGKLQEFKRELISSAPETGLRTDKSNNTLQTCSELVEKNKLHVVDDLITWCLSSEAEIIEFKKTFVHKWGGHILRHLISKLYYYHCKELCPVVFHRDRWERVEMFLTWCFSSENEITEFKRKMFLESTASTIHFDLISLGKWQEAEFFLFWLELEPSELVEVKKKSIFSNMHKINRFMRLNNPAMFAGGKWEKIECFLRWCLSGKDDILEFQSSYEKTYGLDFSEDHEDMKKWRAISDVHYS